MLAIAQLKGLGLVSLLALSVLAAVGLSVTGQNAAAAGETITASKTTFFGSNVVEITVTDENLEDNNDAGEQDEITVGFDVRSGSDHAVEDVVIGDDAGDISAEIGDSGKIVFYVTADLDVDATDLEDPEFDAADVFLISITEGSPDVDIGTDTTNDAFESADDGISLNEGATITLTYGDASLDLTYQDDKADIVLDRSTVGSDGFVYLKIEDQDGNNDPTARDDLIFDGSVDALTITYTGVADDDLGQAIFDGGVDILETSDNSGIFEARLSVEDIFDLDEEDTPKTVTIGMPDFEAYPNDTFYDPGAAGIEGDDDTQESILVDNADGILDVVTPATPRNEHKVTVTDADRNLDSKVKDRITDAIAADLSSGGTDDSEVLEGAAHTPIDLIETGVNTGKFVPDTPGNLIEVTIQDATPNNGIIEIDSAASAKSDLLTRYADMTPNDVDDFDTDLDSPLDGTDDAKTILFKGKAAANTPAVFSLGQTTVGAQDTVSLIITDVDLNDDKDAVDSFELEIAAGSFVGGEVTEEDVEFNDVSIGDLMLESVIGGEEADATYPDEDITLSFQETGKDTSIFAAEFEYQNLAPAADTDDGDNTEFTWFDNLLEDPLESSARLTIGEASKKVEWQVTEFGMPFIIFDPEASEDVEAERTKVKLIITDPGLNDDSSTVETVSLTPVADGDDLTIHIEGADGTDLVSEDDIDECSGFTAQTFTETGANTGIFDKTLDVADDACAGAPEAGAGGFDPEDLANAKLIAEYDDKTASSVFKGYNGRLTADPDIISSGTSVLLTLNDADQNKDRDVVEQIKVEIEPDGLASTFVALSETGTNTGIFTRTVKAGEDFDIIDDEELVEEVIVRYLDAMASDGAFEEREISLIPPTSNGKLVLSPAENFGPQTKVTITLTDVDLNEDPNAEDIIEGGQLSIRTTSDEIGDDTIELGEDGLNMEETANTSGVFVLTLTFDPVTPAEEDADAAQEFTVNGDEIDVPAKPGDVVSIRYEDDNHDSKGSDVISVTIEVKSFDPVITTDKSSYLPGDTLKGTIEDADANSDPDVRDTIEGIDVTSDTDVVGTDVDAVETGPNTGIFAFEADLSESTVAGAVVVAIGDMVTITYEDQFPADYADREESVLDPSKDFQLQVPVGVSADGTPVGDTGATTPSRAAPKDIAGNDLDEVTAGQQIVLSSTITNNKDEDMQYAAIIEVRDADGFTVLLQWAAGTLPAEDSNDIGLSWTPTEAGEYTVRVFVVTSVDNPAALSLIEETTVTVS